ncbi:hypothetical protein QE152_g10108 [Popillia japonica]|uniref:Uncharacterized protein n=1 Tax=Popillia japonica TaxID=7064 RepID=A0AAW1LXG2_POPJA
MGCLVLELQALHPLIQQLFQITRILIFKWNKKPGLVQIVWLTIHPLRRHHPGSLPLRQQTIAISHLCLLVRTDTAVVEIDPTLDPTPGKLLENVISPIPKTSAKAVVKTQDRQKEYKEKNRSPVQKKTVVKQKKRLESSDSDNESLVLQESDTSAEEWDENECLGCGENYFETTKNDEWIKCVNCSRWFHNGCSKFEIFCDLCGKLKKRRHCELIYGLGRNITADNCFTSVGLIEQLRSKKLSSTKGGVDTTDTNGHIVCNTKHEWYQWQVIHFGNDQQVEDANVEGSAQGFVDNALLI